MLRSDASASTVCRRSGLQIACSRVCDLRAVAATDGRFDRVIVQRLQNVAQRCGRIDGPRLQ
eukprot:11223996-Lingulodinium_polyedra.AAC.1